MTAGVPRACVVGWPIRHSRSPIIHGHWLAVHGLAGSYGLAEVSPDDFPAFLAGLAEAGYVGCNVTVPHKETAFHAVAVRTDRAAALEAVNTVWLEGGRLHGDNTDILGYIASLDADAPGWRSATGRALVLGAGGAARGVVSGLLDAGVPRIDIVNRTPDRARAVAERFGPRVAAHGWDAAPALMKGADLLVNTTALGMQGKPPLEIALDPLPDHALVSDIVYVPLETPLLAAARARGLRGVDGLGMLLHQAVPGFEHWFGRRPVVTPELRALVVADIEGRR